MPTVCKITLDTSEYKKQLDEAIAATAAAAEKMSAVSAGNNAPLPENSNPSDGVAELGQAVAALPEKKRYPSKPRSLTAKRWPNSSRPKQ